MNEADKAALVEHVLGHLGPVEGLITVAPVAPGLPSIDLIHVPATESKPWQVLVTAGMSAQEMTPPEELSEEPRYAELLLGLPSDWPLDGGALEDSAFRWPLRLLATLASFPAAAGQWLSVGHTVPNGQPPKPYLEGLGFCCAMLAPPITVLPDFRELIVGPEKTVVFYAVVPLFEREMELKVAEGTRALLERFDKHEVSEILDIRRRSVAGTLLDLLDGSQ